MDESRLLIADREAEIAIERELHASAQLRKEKDASEPVSPETDAELRRLLRSGDAIPSEQRPTAEE